MGTLSWTNSITGATTATMGFEANLAEDHGRLRLHYVTTRRTGETHTSDYWINIVATPQPFGGWRWWFVCPRTGNRVAHLHLPAGATIFASREAYRLGYRLQRESPRDRALTRAFRLRERLDGQGGIGDPIFKPKGMHQATYDRHMTRIEAAESRCNAHLLLAVRKLSPGFKM
ncbi:hypothetical protein [Lichenifustis flavocetrariae]|uniref:Uncharacterized protein n=1 Tax=Lichenifustis flavocetrariae TaxID=2949735 RepID=A0AA41Z1K1_9HYPH|nr:hypothetical protein [Lichenifustis flavocetrariae]MCW6512509.1 hypothetical protein [Lichenifustis flavocetrariae]